MFLGCLFANFSIGQNYMVQILLPWVKVENKFKMRKGNVYNVRLKHLQNAKLRREFYHLNGILDRDANWGIMLQLLNVQCTN